MHMVKVKVAVLVAIVLMWWLWWLWRRGRSWDFAHLHVAVGMHVFAPGSVRELQAFVAAQSGPLAVRGGGYSHGGQTLVDFGTQIDMRRLRAAAYDPGSETVTVQGGCDWRRVLELLAGHGRTVAEMQSYFNFTVGGALAVNCHGRGVRFGTVAETVVSMRVLLADGEVVQCSRTERPDLFRGTLGGYALLGVIVDTTLRTVPNVRVRLETQTVRATEAAALVVASAARPDVALFNVNVYPERLHDAVAFAWVTCPSEEDALVPLVPLVPLVQPKGRWYWGHMAVEQLVRRTRLAKLVRAHLEPATAAAASTVQTPVPLSFAMAEDANKLGVLLRRPSSTVLQEYFVPVAAGAAQRLVDALTTELLLPSEVNLLNLSLRHVRRCYDSVLNYAPQDMLAAVLYLNVWVDADELRRLRAWTDRVLRVVKALGGTFYLPYLQCYDPRAALELYGDAWPRLLELKKTYDPSGKWTHQMHARLTAAT